MTGSDTKKGCKSKLVYWRVLELGIPKSTGLKRWHVSWYVRGPTASSVCDISRVETHFRTCPPLSWKILSKTEDGNFTTFSCKIGSGSQYRVEYAHT